MDTMHTQLPESCPYWDALVRVAPAGVVRLKHPSQLRFPRSYSPSQDTFYPQLITA